MAVQAMHDPNAEVAEKWDAAWTVVAPYPTQTTRLYQKEIVRLRRTSKRIQAGPRTVRRVGNTSNLGTTNRSSGRHTQASAVGEQLDSSSRIVRRQAAKATQTLVKELKAEIAPQAPELITKFIQACVGRVRQRARRVMLHRQRLTSPTVCRCVSLGTARRI